MVDQTYPKEGNTNTESQSQTNGLSLPVQYLCNLPEQHPRSTMDLFVKLSCQLLHHCHWAIFVCSKFPYLFAQDSQHLFVQNSQLYKFVCLLVYLFPQPQNPIFTSQSFASVFWKMKNCCFVVKKNLKLETWSFLGTCWLFGSWMLNAD